MGIYRGPGGTGDAVNDASSEAAITTQARDAALAAQAAAEAAEAGAVAAQIAAESAENTVASSATAAAASASSAASSASSASSSASSASTSATSANNSKNAAATSATNAATSASSASTSATNAAASASTATTQASNASTSATNAANSATAAASSASAAASSATSASNSASTATTQATNASNSASAAATSATNAANSASAAATSETNAQTAETNAETAETNAAASAALANDWATKTSGTVAGGEYSAKYHAQQAATSATNASTSESNAASSASAAASSASAAASSFDSFDDRYLGAKASAPSVDNDGNTLLVGALYFNTADNSMKVWDGSAWLDAYASLSGAVTSVSGSAPISSSGGSSPVISISQASGSTDGYLSSTDWTTFNNIQNTLTSGTAGQYLISTGTSAPTWTSLNISDSVGSLRYFEGSTTPPSGYIPCDGSVYAQSTYPALYAVVGTIANNPYLKSQTTNIASLITGIGPLPSGQYAYGNSAGVIGRSTDGGITYSNPSYVTGTSALLANILTTNPNSTLGNIIYASNGTAQYSFDGITYIAQGNGSAGVNALFTDGTTLGISFGATDYGTRTNWGSFSSTSAGYSIRSVARFNSSTFVFVGTGGNIQTATGLNRAGATSRTSGTTSDIFAVTVNTDSQFYVYGGAGGVLGTSTNGITWTVRSSGTSSTIRSLAYGNSLYVYGGDGGALATSTDGITWTAVGAGYNTPVFRIVYGNGRFVAATPIFFLTSTNGTTWESAAPDISSGSVTGLEFMPGYGFVGATSSGAMLRSFDGLVWTQYSSYTNTNITQFALTNTTYAYVDAASRLFYGTSTNAFLETLAPSRAGTGTYNTVAFGNGVYVYATSTGNILVARSRLGHKAPVPLSVGTNPFVFFANGLFLAGANGGFVNTSTDGIRWLNTSTGTTSNITALGFGNGLYLYGTAGGGLATSTDGNTWTARTSGITNDISDFAYGGGRYVGVCAASSNIITSTDGITWTVTTSPSGEFISQVVYGSGRFVSNTTNASNTWLTSTNGLTWSNIGTLNLTSNTGLGTDGTNFVIAAGPNYVTSTNGVAWSAATQWIRTNGAVAPSKLVYDGTHYVGAWTGNSASNGVSFTSSNGTTWEFSGALPFVNSGGGRLAVSGSTIVLTMAGFYTDPISGVFVSTNGGQSWRSINVSAIASNHLRQASFVNGAFFAQLGASTTSPLYTSTNGITWSAVATTGFASLTYNLPMQYQNGIYLLATTGGRVFTSTNSTAWTERSFPVGSINAITSALGRFYCSSNFTVGSQTSNTYYSSTDGINWELYQGATTTNAMTVADYNATANLIAFAGAGGTLQATKPVTYDTTTQFAVPIQRYPELTGNGRLYIKAS